MRWLKRFGMEFVRSRSCKRFALIGSGIVMASLCWLLFSLPERPRLTDVRTLPPSETPQVSRLPNVGLSAPFGTPGMSRLPNAGLSTPFGTPGMSRLPQLRELPSLETSGLLLPGAPGEPLLPGTPGEPLLPEVLGQTLLPGEPGEPRLPEVME